MKSTLKACAITACLILASCGQDNSTDMVNGDNVDLILTNGKVLTIDDQFSIHNTVIVDAGRSVATGSAALASQYSSDKLVDLGGKVLMPGFNDSHTHFRGRPQR